MPSFPTPHKQEHVVLQPSAAQQRQLYHCGNEVIVSDMMKGSLPQHDGLPRTYLSPFQRSSSPSSIALGKENNMQDRRRETKDNQPTAMSRERRTAAQMDQIIDGPFTRTREQATWSPQRGKREMKSADSAFEDTRKTDEAEDINRDFERLLDKIHISDTVRSRLTPLDTPLKRSLLRSPLALNNLIGSDSSPSTNSPARPNVARSRAQSTVPATTGGGYSTSPRKDKDHHIGQIHRQIRKSQSGASLRGTEEGSPALKRTQGNTAEMKTEYVDNLKFEVLNGSPVSSGTDKRQRDFSRPGNGKRASYHHTAEGIPVPPPLLPDDGFSPGSQDKEYDFLHDALQTSRNGDLNHGSCNHGYETSSIGTASSNSSAGSRPLNQNSKPDRIEKKNKHKRSSVFSTKTKSSKKDGYTTGDESSFRTAVSEKGKKDSKRMSYTFGQTFSRSKTPSNATEHLQLPGTRMNEAGSASVDQRSDDLPVTMAVFLRDAKTFEVDVDRVKRLRLLLGSESTSWVQTFIDAGGYKHLLSRLQDLLDVEWRSEQHDDQLFFEILRCIKGLTTSEAGKVAIIEHGASPFRELVALLYSEKKPGEVPPKQLIIDLVFSLFDIYRSVSSTDGKHPMVSSPRRRGPSPLTWEVNHTPNHRSSTYFSSALPSSRDSSCNDNPLQGSDNDKERIPGGYHSISGFILSLLREPPEIVDNSSSPTLSDAKGNRKSIIIAPASELPAPKLEMHDFIAAAHKPRIFKTYMKELSQACWDFFWIMHYSKNGIWNLADVDPETIKPRVPNGASAGVEFEAMRYLTSHFKLINTLTRTLIEQDLANDDIRKDMRKGEACRFHSDMMFSGMDRILCTVRKASTDLYPEFHLELARYIKLAKDAEYDLPYVIKALITPPPHPYRRSALMGTGQQYGTPTSRHRHKAQDNYRPMQLLDAANGECALQTTKWLPTPTEKGDFDFQI